MDSAVELLLVLVILADFVLLGTSRIAACIRAAAFQGVLLGILTLAAHADHLTARTVAIACGSALLKGAFFPWLLSRPLRESDVRREVEPYVGFTLSMAAGLVALGVALWLASRLPVPAGVDLPLLLPTALFTMLVGLFVIVSRRKALTQVVGYVVLENGIYAFGVALALEEPFLVEFGVLLDVFVAVFVMGIAIFHIHREFDHIDADRLVALRDVTRRWDRPA